MMQYVFEIIDFKTVDHEKIKASMTIVINDAIELHNCCLVYAPQSGQYRLGLPSKAYIHPSTGRTCHCPLVKLSASLSAKALAAAVEMYEQTRN